MHKDLNWAIELMKTGCGCLGVDCARKDFDKGFLLEVLEGYALYLDEKGLL